MTTNFPTSLDSLTNPTSGDTLNTTGVVHSVQHGNANDAIEALEVKVGADSSTDINSLDYKISNMESGLVLTDVTTNNASTTKHGFLLKATAPASGIRNVVAIDNGETVYKNTALVDNTNPAALGTAAPGTSLITARRDHVHATEVEDTITDGHTTLAPSGNAVFGALALKLALAGGTMTGQLVMGNHNVHGLAVSLSDDSATSFTPDSTVGWILFHGGSGGSAGMYGLAIYRVGASPYITLIFNHTNLQVGTSALTGTTGTDGKFTIAAVSDGKIYLENRMGSASTPVINLF